MSTHDEIQATNTTEMSADDNNETTWMDVNDRGQIVKRPRRFHGLTHREGFANYVERAYWTALRMGLLEELAMLPLLEGKPMTEIAGLTREISERIRERMRDFHDEFAQNVHYGALTRMVAAAKEDVGRMAALQEERASPRRTWAALAASSVWPTAETAEPDANTFVPTPLPALPTSPLIRHSGEAVAETVSDSEYELGLWDTRIASATATGWTDISGHPFVAQGGLMRSVSGCGDSMGDAIVLGSSAEEDGDGHAVTGSAADDGEDADDEDGDGDGDDHEVTGSAADDGEETEPEEDGAQIQHVPVPATVRPPAAGAILQKEIRVELPLWAWLALLVALAAWAALVNGVLSRAAFGR